MAAKAWQILKRNPSPTVFVLGLLFILALEWVMQPQAIGGVYFQRWSSEDMMQTVSVVDLRAEPLASLYYLHVQPPLLDASARHWRSCGRRLMPARW